jgi:hypothetical protein
MPRNGNENLNVALCLNRLAVVLDNLGRYTEEEQVHRQPLEMTQHLRGAEHPDACRSFAISQVTRAPTTGLVSGRRPVRIAASVTY